MGRKDVTGIEGFETSYKDEQQREIIEGGVKGNVFLLDPSNGGRIQSK
jgi:hypothetical protein